MKYIEKGEEPEILIQYKKKYPYGNYDDAGFKSYVPQIRNTLVDEDMLDDIAESYVEMYGFADYIGQYMEFVRNKADSV